MGKISKSKKQNGKSFEMRNGKMENGKAKCEKLVNILWNKLIVRSEIYHR